MEEEQTSQSPQDAPDSPELVAVPEALTPDPTPVTTVAAVDPSRDYDAELAIKDAEIKRLSDAWVESKNSHHMTKDEINRARVALAEAVQERERLVAAKDQALAETQEQLETVSQATQVLSKEKQALTSELETQAAKATKLEVLTEEYPELLRYARLIPASRDPEVVRAACAALQEARQLDMEAQRMAAVTGNPMNALPSTPATRVDTTLSDPERMRTFLAEAMGDPKEYERRRQLLLDQLEAAKARSQVS